MTSCTAHPCSNRNKCRPPSKQCHNINAYEVPERDMPQSHPQNGQLPPPEPPTGDWDLQYCQWQGWTWVKKENKSVQSSKHTSMQTQQQQTKSMQPQEQQTKTRDETLKTSESNQSRKKKKGGIFSSCFKKKDKHPPESAKSSGISLQTGTQPVQIQPAKSEHEVSKSTVPRSEDFDDHCCCCPCNQVCCPCMLQTCCCCNGDQSFETVRKKDCKSIETQTCGCEVKEQATKMSDVDVSKHVQYGARKRCRCRRAICCPCMRPTCCPCVQTTCCPCKQNEDKPLRKDTKSEIVNYCLTNNHKSNVDFLNLKTDFSTLHKSLDLLIKNNINIMGLFSDRKEMSDIKAKPSTSFDGTISFLSNDNRTDHEHSKLLTAVCDAILSSHKFDNDKLSPSVKLKETVSKSSQKHCETKDSDSFSSRGFLEKILSDLNFPTVTKSDEDFKDIGKKTRPKLVRNKSRILATPRFPRKVEALKKTIDLMRLGYYDRGPKRTLRMNVKKSDQATQASTSKQDDVLHIDFLSSSASKTCMEVESQQAIHLFDASDLELLLSLDDKKTVGKEK